MKRKLWILTVFGVVSVLAADTLPAQERRMENEKTFQQMFPLGEPLPEQFSKYFIGQAWRAPLTTNGALNVPVSNITFCPGAATTGTATRAANS